MGPDAGEFEQNSAAGGVVHGAVVNLVAGFGRVNAEMIVVRGVENGFAVFVGVGALQHGEHIARDEGAQLAGHVGFQMDR